MIFVLALRANLALAQAEGAEAGAADITETIVDDAPASAGEGEDVVELISSDAGPSSVPLSPPAPPSNNITLRGWARQSFELTFFDGGYDHAAPDPLAVPYDRLVSRTQLYMRASYVQDRWFEATVSGLLRYSVREEGPAGLQRFNGVNGQVVRTQVEPDLRELYLGLFSSYVDLRIGQQRVPWGRMDVISPNDVLNARDLRDPFLIEDELRIVPTPLVRADVDLGTLTLQGVFAPVFIPDRFDVYGSNWAVIQPDAPPAVRGFLGLTRSAIDDSLRDQLDELLHQTRLPMSYDGMSAGARLGLVFDAADFAFYYHYGYDSTPFLWVDRAFSDVLSRFDFANAHLEDLTPALRALDQGLQPLYAEYVRRHHIGVDGSTTLGSFVLRFDAAFQTERVYYRRDLESFASPAVLAVLAVEYQTGEIDRTVILELIYSGILETPPPLIAYVQHSYGAALLARWSFGDHFGIDLRATLNAALFSYTVQPTLYLELGDFVIKLGGLMLNGAEWSLGWWYRRNTTAFAVLRYNF